jgi:hypothetical protein
VKQRLSALMVPDLCCIAVVVDLDQRQGHGLRVLMLRVRHDGL